MTYKEIETRLLNLEKAFLQSQQNNVKVTENADKAPVLEDKVNKEEGKALSSNDYTNIDKEKLEVVERNGDGLSLLGPIYLIKDVHYFDSIAAIPKPYASGRLYLVKVEE